MVRLRALSSSFSFSFLVAISPFPRPFLLLLPSVSGWGFSSFFFYVQHLLHLSLDPLPGLFFCLQPHPSYFFLLLLFPSKTPTTTTKKHPIDDKPSFIPLFLFSLFREFKRRSPSRWPWRRRTRRRSRGRRRSRRRRRIPRRRRRPRRPRRPRRRRRRRRPG